MNNEIGWKLKRLNDEMHRQANNNLHEHNLTFSQLKTMIYLAHQPDHTSPLKAMEKRFEVAQATMAGIVSRLETKDFVESFVNPEDRRIKMVRLTQNGISEMEKHREEAEAAEKMLLSVLTEEEQEDLNRYLDLMYENLIKNVGKGNYE